MNPANGQPGGMGDPLMQDRDRAASQRVARQRGPRPRDFKFTIDIPYDAPEDAMDAEADEAGRVR